MLNDLTVGPQFVGGRVYDRWPEINDPFGGSRQSGISTSRKTPAIFLFTGETGEQYGYRDKFDDSGVFSYTGEGQLGDMKLDKGNLAIVNHAADGRALHVFQTLGKAKGQKYIGEFTYASHQFLDGPDKSGSERKVIIFHLVPVAALPDDLEDSAAPDSGLSPKGLSLEEARIRALAALLPAEQTDTSQSLRTLYKRSKAVRDYVLLRSKGHCESCKNPSPFTRRNGTAYLEPHHTTRVSDGGLDHPRYVGAICPSCHREIHHGVHGDDRNAALIKHLEAIEPLA